MRTLLNFAFVFLLSAANGAAQSGISLDGQGSLPVVAENPAVLPVPSAGVRARSDAPGFCVFSRSGSFLGGEVGFKAVIGGSDVIFAGETHDRMQDHLAQLESLKALHSARGGKIVVGFEMLNMTLQPVLEAYAAGKLSEEEFLLKSDWQKEWGFDFNLYRPLFSFIRAQRLKALALNLPKKVVAKIARVGLSGLSPEEKRYLPARVQITDNAAYLKYMRDIFESHGKNTASGGRGDFAASGRGLPGAKQSGMAGFTFDNYLAAMCAWNEAMGARLADFVNANPGYAALVVAGSGHVIYNAGIPASFASRTAPLRSASFYPQSAAACPAALPAGDAGLADYVWYMESGAGVKQ